MREWVVITGQAGFENFNFAMQGLEVYLPVRSYRVQYRKVNKWVFNIYEKAGPYKIILDTSTKKFKAYHGTTFLGESNTAKSCFTRFIK